MHSTDTVPVRGTTVPGTNPGSFAPKPDRAPEASLLAAAPSIQETNRRNVTVAFSNRTPQEKLVQVPAFAVRPGDTIIFNRRRRQVHDTWVLGAEPDVLIAETDAGDLRLNEDETIKIVATDEQYGEDATPLSAEEAVEFLADNPQLVAVSTSSSGRDSRGVTTSFYGDLVNVKVKGDFVTMVGDDGRGTRGFSLSEEQTSYHRRGDDFIQRTQTDDYLLESVFRPLRRVE